MTESEDRPTIRNLEELTGFFESVRTQLEKIVRFRLDPAFQARIEPADVLQEAFFQIAKRFPELIDTPEIHPLVWLRQRVLQTLWDLQRTHGRDKRSVHREQPTPVVDAASSSVIMAQWLIDDMTSPSQRLIKDEDQARLQRALESMTEIDREILALRHFEYLTNLQAAQTLGISPTAASNRYIRAALRLSEILQEYGSINPSPAAPSASLPTTNPAPQPSNKTSSQPPNKPRSG